MMVSIWWNQKFWFNVCQHSFLFGSLNFRNSGKMCRPGDLAYFECWRFDIQSPLIVLTAKYLRRFLKINGSQIPISFSRCTVNCSFWSKNDNVRPVFTPHHCSLPPAHRSLFTWLWTSRLMWAHAMNLTRAHGRIAGLCVRSQVAWQ